MHNFYHEIPLPDDKAIRKFLWISYFHDSTIEEILLGQPQKDALTLKLQCSCDGFTYLLQFDGVRHFEYASPRQGWHAGEEISSTRFKDTALLHRLQKEEGRPLYHLRFSHWDGYTDVIFRQFSLRKEGGRVNYKCEIPMEAVSWQHQLYAPHGTYLPGLDPSSDKYATMYFDDPEALRELEDDFTWTHLYRLEQSGDTEVLKLQAQDILDHARDCPHALLYAAFLLGKHGSEEDLITLAAQLLREQNLLRRRVIMDALELIYERETE